MKKNLIAVLAHQDDELCIFNRLSNFSYKENIFIFYMTSGMDINSNKNSLSKRDLESLKVLRKLGVKKKIFFFLEEKIQLIIINYTNI